MTIPTELEVESSEAAPGIPRRGATRSLGIAIEVLKRLGALIVTVLAASLVVVAALSLAPGSPISYLAGGQEVTPEVAARLTEQYHLDQPWFLRWLAWLTDAIHGNFGTSLFYQDTVAHLVTSRLPTTLLLVGYASVLTIALGVALGLASALRRGLLGSILSGASTTAIAVPPFVIAILLLAAFAVAWPVFPALGGGSGFLDQLYHLTLPAVSLALGASAAIARVTRASVQAELGREHVETAILRGLPRRTVVRRHVVRNALIPILTISGLSVAAMMAGTVVIESVFGLQGVGSLLVQAIGNKDYAVVQLIVPLLVFVFLVVNTVVDFSYRFVDPRLRDTGDRR